jgi:hypothetical protein
MMEKQELFICLLYMCYPYLSLLLSFRVWSVYEKSVDVEPWQQVLLVLGSLLVRYNYEVSKFINASCNEIL